MTNGWTDYWEVALEVDRRLSGTGIDYCVIKSFCGDRSYDDGNIDVVVSAPLLTTHARAFAPRFSVSSRDRWKHRLYERNKLMIEDVEGEFTKIHLHSNAGWHDLCFVSADEILANRERLDLAPEGSVWISSNALERKLEVLHSLFENFGMSQRHRELLDESDFRAFASEYEIPDAWIEPVIATESTMFDREVLRPVWQRYYEVRGRRGEAGLRPRVLHAAYLRLRDFRSWKKARARQARSKS